MERDLTREQALMLLFEMHSARQLLATGCQLLISSHGLDGKFDALATLWSIGVEKTLKIALGLTALASGNDWPNGKANGHDILKMNGQLSTHLRSWMADSPQSEWLMGLVAGTQNDPVWHSLLQMLDAYGNSGRFANLDRLAQVAKPPTNPRTLWPGVENAVLDARPALRDALFHDPPLPTAEHNAALLAMNRDLARALARWWFVVARAGAFGAYGAQAKRFTPELDPGLSLPALPDDLRTPT